ncbi:NADPH:quinone oxidoreductase family protein [Sphingomonas bisphenolicum]|uniref:NADPH:quinone oxidoreductase n=1 Tax=Sphingomonas bisphenolicum TaxID=296544 RepID=A0ABN5WBY8_9SPHN|nr:NADPH:quinone oxidoreductase family protein [Sphingomonas bisphenolicum]BBF69732.1 NADPH:quinone oxidoreductase [Sphingomonas bisphenolicum]
MTTDSTTLDVTKAVLCFEYGPPDTLRVSSVALPPLDPANVRIRVMASGINFPDTLIMLGKYQLRPELPFAPGFEVAGEIIEVGDAAGGWSVGTRVVGLTASGYGGFAEYVDVRGELAVGVPADVDDVTAAGIYAAYGTAYHALVQRGGVKPGQQVVVLGATGGVGLAAVDIASALGAEVIAIGSSATKLELALAAGAKSAIVYVEGELGKQIKSETAGHGADICIDVTGGKAFAEMSRAMAWEGRLLVIGFTSGEIPVLPVNLLLLKGYSAVGVYWGRFSEIDPDGHVANFEALWRLMAEGRITPHIHKTYPMESAAAALNDLLSRKTAGKLVLTPFSQ